MTLMDESPSVSHTATVADHIIEVVYRVILVATVAAWTFVGFLAWVPLLIRTTAFFAAAVFYATLFGDQDRVTAAEQSVKFAVDFYVRGFHHFSDFYVHRHDPARPVGLLGPLKEMKWRELLIESLWVVGVWFGLYQLIKAGLLALSSLFA